MKSTQKTSTVTGVVRTIKHACVEDGLVSILYELVALIDGAEHVEVRKELFFLAIEELLKKAIHDGRRIIESKIDVVVVAQAALLAGHYGYLFGHNLTDEVWHTVYEGLEQNHQKVAYLFLMCQTYEQGDIAYSKIRPDLRLSADFVEYPFKDEV